MADPHTVVDGDVSAERPSEGWTPDLRVSEDLTPLPYVDRALPILGLFAGLVGRGTLTRYRVALLRELAAQPRARMKIWETQESVDWLEPASVTRLMQDLRGRRRPARSSLSEVLRDAGRFDEAVDVCDQAWRTYGTLKALQDKVNILAARGHLDGAQACAAQLLSCPDLSAEQRRQLPLVWAVALCAFKPTVRWMCGSTVSVSGL
jgi:hypothetical protein